MTDERMMEELARLDGVDVSNGVEFIESDKSYQTQVMDTNWYQELDNYLEDANATKRIVRGMNDGVRVSYAEELCLIMRDKEETDKDARPSSHEEAVELILRSLVATVRQEAEAILRAYFVWEE